MIFLSYVKIICAHAGNYFVDMDIGGGKEDEDGGISSTD